MSYYVLVETVDGSKVAMEVDDNPNEEMEFLGKTGQALKSFEEATEHFVESAKFILGKAKELAPQEVEVSFAMKVGVEAGNTFWALAKASSEGTFTVSIKWAQDERLILANEPAKTDGQ